MKNVYDHHDAAFSSVSAYAVLHKGEVVAKVAFKFPRDGAGRLYAYVHWFGSAMARGHAAGMGYDKRTAACASAVGKPGTDWPYAFHRALAKDSGNSWDRALRDAGYEIVHVV